MAEMIPDQQGRLRHITLALPGAGIDLTVTQDAGVRWRFKSLRFVFDTDANAADRHVRIVFILGGTNVLVLWPQQDHKANTNRGYLVSTVSATEIDTNGALRYIIAPEDMLFNNQVVIATLVESMQVGDQLSAAELLVEEWIEPLA